jgi:hypothetical protein
MTEMIALTNSRLPKGQCTFLTNGRWCDRDARELGSEQQGLGGSGLGARVSNGDGRQIRNQNLRMAP